MKAIFQLLNPDNTMSINRQLAHSIGLTEAVLYSALLSKYSYYEQHGLLTDDGWFYSTAEDMEESTALTVKQQRKCVDKLEDAGLIKCKVQGMPARRYFYIIDDVDLLTQILSNGGKSSLSKRAKLDDTDETAEKQSNGITQPSKHSEDASSVCPKGQTCFTLSANPVCPNRENPTLNKSKDNNLKIINHINQSCFVDTAYIHTDERENCLQNIRENIGYDALVELNTEKKEIIDELIILMVDTICSTRPTVRINNDDVPQSIVKSTFLKLNDSHIEYVLDAMDNNTTNIKNIRSYLLTALYNAPSTLKSYWNARVNHDMMR